MLSEHYVNSETFTVKELLGFHPNGLNYFQPTNDTLHIKFDEEGTPIPPETPIAVEITTPVTSNTEDPKSLAKYYRQRYDFFHRFDEGIQIDTEGWYSVTPEAIGHHIAQHSTPGSVVWDAFAGVGGNSIQYALAGMNVVATELDPDRIRMCRENARIYGVDQYIDFLQADALSMKNIWRGGFDTVFLSPPWGGPEYLKSEVYDALTMLPIDCKAMIETATRMKGKLVFYMPKNTELTRLATLLPPNATLTIEKHYLDDRLKVLVIHVL
jgi:trimethylguanosine synthase